MRTLIKVLFAAMVLVVSCMPANADSACSAGSVCTVTLTQSNVQQLAGVVVTVTIDNTGSATVLSFQLTSSPITNSPIGIDMVGWNANTVQTGTKKQGKATVPVFGSDPAANSVSSTNFGGNQTFFPSGQGNLDGFGSFDVNGADSAGNGGISSPIIFTLGGLITNFPANSNGNEFAVHVRYGNCSGFVGGQSGTGSSNSDPNCLTTSQTPEPASLALFGTGMVALGGLVRRRNRR